MKIAAASWLGIPGPRKTIEIHVSTGRPIAAIDTATHNRCKRRPIRARAYDQSANAALIAPKPAANSCIKKILTIRFP
jgi:hypothetical protein